MTRPGGTAEVTAGRVEEPARKPNLVPAPAVCQMGMGVRAESDPPAPSARFAMVDLEAGRRCGDGDDSCHPNSDKR
jgi:hypothetical protein